MKRLLFYIRYSLRSLRRDGMRSLLAGLSVAFGVLSLVAMQLLSNALLHGSLFDMRIQYGGDAQILPEQFGQGFSLSDMEQIEAWHEQGYIAEYTPVSDGSAAYLRTPTNGRVTFVLNARGIDPATYPLVGELVLREPAGASAADVLQNPTDVLVTRDIADERGLRIGDSILLSGSSTPIELTVAGIVGATPDQQGDSVFYALDTARLIENRENVINTISATWGSAPDAAQTVIDSPFQVYIAVDRDEAVQSSSGTALFDLMLKGAGVLGLLVGGLSVSNTLQVILARRKLEIAMLKSLGYQRSDLLTLISLETGLIGLAGGAAGALIGTEIARKLIDVLGGAGALMLDWHPDPVIILGGVIAGTVTAVVFGMQAILVSSATRPVQLLRDLPVRASRGAQLGRGGLYLVMLLIFGALVGVVLGSPLEGVLYVVVGSIALVLLRAAFWCVMWLVLKLPLPRFPMLRLARANLRQRKNQASLVVLALFAGAFSVTFAALAIYNAQEAVTRVRGSDEGFNLMIYTNAEGAANAVGHMIAQGAQETYVTERVQGMVNGESVSIEGRDAADIHKEMQYDGAWSDDEAIALMPDFESSRYSVGDTLTLEIGGQTQQVTLAGFFSMDANSLSLSTARLIIPRSLMQRFDDVPRQTRAIGSFPVNRLPEVTSALGLALPNALIFSRADLNDALVNTYRALFTFAASVAGLAFVAGAVLIANSAGLAVVERRREIGVFKAVGYTSSHVLRVLLSEYGFLGVLAGVFGVAAAVSAVYLINATQPGAQLTVEPVILTGMLALSVSVAVISAAIVAWQPTRVRPLDVLRYE